MEIALNSNQIQEGQVQHTPGYTWGVVRDAAQSFLPVTISSENEKGFLVQSAFRHHMNLLDTSITASTVPSIIQEVLRKLYEFDNPAKIIEFLEDNPKVSMILILGFNKIRKFFPNSPIKIKYVADPEIPNMEFLGVYVMANVSPGEAVSQLGEFDIHWGFDATKKADNRIMFSLDF